MFQGVQLTSVLLIAATVACTVFGQVAMKYQISAFAGHRDSGLRLLSRLAFSPLAIAAIAAYVVGLVAWTLALRRLELSFAYPFMSLSFVGVSLAAAVFLGEDLRLQRAAGLALIVVGIIVGGRS